MYRNFKWTWERKGKHIFAPSPDADRRGDKIIDFCDREVDFPLCFYHYRKGGHVTALHGHLQNRFFFKIDIQNFFYSISRNRIAAALHSAGFPWARNFAKWSSVRSPYDLGPRYCLPIGFKQSPALASLVLMRSPVMAMVAQAEQAGAFVSIYLDDLICSANDEALLEALYDAFLAAFAEANLTPNPTKLVPPTDALVVFNCDLRHGFAQVTPDRIAEYFAEPRSAASLTSFAAYCAKVSEANI
ncbi:MULTISPECIES: reverse transcriptase domain-containing protein [unclassified Bradyrhizobium]